MSLKESLTNEQLRKNLNNFELAHYAIRLARYYVHSGHEISLGQLFDQIRKHPSPQFIEDLEAAEKEDN